jgi:hypothetical protein
MKQVTILVPGNRPGIELSIAGDLAGPSLSGRHYLVKSNQALMNTE